MSDDSAVHPWRTTGEPTSTNYALGGKNEFGQRVPPKPTFNLHGIQVKDALRHLNLHDLCEAFYRLHGKLPTELHLPGPRQADRARSCTLPGLGMAFLDIRYGAEVVHVR